jgi:hypothetical protein
MIKLTALGFVQYQVQIFGDPGKYHLTDLGKNLLPQILGQQSSTGPLGRQATDLAILERRFESNQDM